MVFRIGKPFFYIDDSDYEVNPSITLKEANALSTESFCLTTISLTSCGKTASSKTSPYSSEKASSPRIHSS